MALTKTQIVERAAYELGILRLNQSLQSQDQTRLEQAYDEVYADLKEDGVATWASTASVPTDVVPHIVAMVAFNAVDTYGVSNDRYQRIAGKASVAKKKIDSLQVPAYVSQEEPTDF